MKPFEEREKMYQITAKEILNPTVVKMEILAPAVAKKALPGQFIILRVEDVYKRQVQDIMQNGYVTDKAYLGITGGTVTQQMQMQYNLPDVYKRQVHTFGHQGRRTGGHFRFIGNAHRFDGETIFRSQLLEGFQMRHGIGFAGGIQAVSYTHLDVYKRQGEKHPEVDVLAELAKLN